MTGRILYHNHVEKANDLKRFDHAWRADGRVINEVSVNKINRKRPFGRPRTHRVVDVVAQDIKNIKE